MPNISAASAKKRRVLGNEVHSLLLFGAPIWTNHMSASGKAKLARIQRKRLLGLHLHIVTVDAALVVASMPLIDFLAIERLNMYHNKIDPEAR